MHAFIRFKGTHDSHGENGLHGKVDAVDDAPARVERVVHDAGAHIRQDEEPEPQVVQSRPPLMVPLTRDPLFLPAAGRPAISATTARYRVVHAPRVAVRAGEVRARDLRTDGLDAQDDPVPIHR